MVSEQDLSGDPPVASVEGSPLQPAYSRAAGVSRQVPLPTRSSRPTPSGEPRVRYDRGMERLRALNNSLPVTVAGTVVVVAVLAALVITDHNGLVITIGGICGAILIFQDWNRRRDR